MGIINAECGKTFRIAYQGENKRQQVRFDLTDIMGEFPGGTAVLAVLRNGDADPVPAAETEMDGTALIWTVTAWECALEGFLYAQVTYAAGETVAKTKVYRFDVKNSLVVNGAEPEDWQDLVGQLVTAADGVNSAISAAMDTLDEKVTAAEAAQDAAEDAQEAAETAMDEAVAAVGQYDAMTAEATGLAAGDEPTAVIDHTGDHPVLQLGIPKGEKGDTGATGQAGPAGPSGVDGFSPTAGVSKVGKIATITIVDKNGTTTASVSDGADGDPGDIIDDTAGAGDTDKTFSADKLTADHNSLLNAITSLDNSKAPIIIDSASGAIATFPDGAEGLPLESLVVGIEPVQSGTGDPSPSNVRPITGWTGCNVTRTGKNLFNKSSFTAFNDVYIDTTSGEVKSGQYNKAFVVPVNPGTYTISVVGMNVSNRFGAFDSMPVVGSVSTAFVNVTNTGKTGTITAPSGTKYLMFVYNNTAVTQTYTEQQILDSIQIEVGSSASTYEPYTGQTYPVTWQTEAGTVYGGTVDVVTGELVVDRASIILNGTVTDMLPGWQAISGSSAWLYRATLTPGIEETAGTYTIPNIISDMLPTVAYTPIYGGTIGISRVQGTGAVWGLAVRVQVEGLTTAQLINAWLAEHPIHVVYKVSNPQTYTLTPIEIRTLIGYNAIFADTGDVAVDYRADTKLFVEKTEVSGVQDVKVNGTSVVTDGVANVPLATTSTNGAMSATDKSHLDSVYADYSSALTALGVI